MLLEGERMSVWELSGKEQHQDSNLLRARWKPELFPAGTPPSLIMHGITHITSHSSRRLGSWSLGALTFLVWLQSPRQP